jgi:hypothetical protein
MTFKGTIKIEQEEDWVVATCFGGFDRNRFPDGVVNRALWNFVFDRRNNDLLGKISIISKYGSSQLRMVEINGGILNFSRDNKLKMFSRFWGADGYYDQIVYYFINSYEYFILHEWHMGDSGQVIYVNSNLGFKKIVNGVSNEASYDELDNFNLNAFYLLIDYLVN